MVHREYVVRAYESEALNFIGKNFIEEINSIEFNFCDVFIERSYYCSNGELKKEVLNWTLSNKIRNNEIELWNFMDLLRIKTRGYYDIKIEVRYKID